MSDLASFLPRHFAAPPQGQLNLSTASLDCPPSILSTSSSPTMSSQPFRRGSMSGFSSTASDSSSTDSPAGGFSSSSSGSASPSPPLKGRLFFPPSLVTDNAGGNSNNAAMAALLPSAPDLKRQQSQPPVSSTSSTTSSSSQPATTGKLLWINTERPQGQARAAASKHSASGAAAMPNVPSFTPPSSPAGSSSPLTATDLPNVHSMRISVSPAADYSSPASSPLSASFTASPSIPQPRSPAPHLRHVPLVTPPCSPSKQAGTPMSNTQLQDTASSSTSSPPSPPSTCLSLGDSLALSFRPENSLPELLASISMVIHVQLIKDEQASDEAKNRLPAFRELPSPNSPSRPAVCPSVRSIYQFLLHVFQRGRFQSELALLSLVYVHRAMASSRVALTPSNFRPLFIASLCLANKMWDDTPLINADFRILYPQLLGCSTAHALSKQQYLAVFNKLETQLCSAIDWNLGVSTDTFHLYLHELQAIWTEYEHGLHTQQSATNTNTATTTAAQHTNQPPSHPQPSQNKGAGKMSVHSHRHHPYASSKRTTRAPAASMASADGKYDSDGEPIVWQQSVPVYQSASLHHMPIPLQQAVL